MRIRGRPIAGLIPLAARSAGRARLKSLRGRSFPQADISGRANVASRQSPAPQSSKRVSSKASRSRDSFWRGSAMFRSILVGVNGPRNGHGSRTTV